MDTLNSPLPPGSNVGMFADNSVALHWEVDSWRQRVPCQTMNLTNRRLLVPQSLVLSGVAAIENVPVFEMPAEINMPVRMLYFRVIQEIVRNRDSLVEFIRQWIDRINDLLP